MAQFGQIFILLTVEFVLFSMENFDPESEPYSVPHCDALYILLNFTSIQGVSLASGYQIAASLGQDRFDLSTVLTPLLISVQSGANTSRITTAQYALNRGIITWIYYSENDIPIQKNLHLDDQIFYYGNSDKKLYELYGVKDVVVRQEIIQSSESQLKRRMDFRGATIHVVEVKQYECLGRAGDEMEKWTNDRISCEFLAQMQAMLNFNVEFHSANSWVYAISPTQPSMADLVNRSEADLAVTNTGLWPTEDFRFLFLTRVFSEVYVYYHPTHSTKKGFAGVVQPQVWICFLVFGFGIFLMTACFFRQDSKQSFSWVFAILTERGSEEPSVRHLISARIFAFVTSSYGLIFYVSISAILISTLSITMEISDLSELLQRGYSFGGWENSIIDNGFKLGLMSEKSPLHKVKSSYSSLASEQEGAKKVATTAAYAFVSSNDLFLDLKEFMEEIGACRGIKTLTVEGEKRWGSAFVKVGSEFSDHFNHVRLHMYEVGLASHHLGHIEREAELVKQNCLAQTPSSNTVIQIEDVALIFYIFLVGLLISTLIFLCERWEVVMNDK